jgi:hypothetical protein
MVNFFILTKDFEKEMKCGLMNAVVEISNLLVHREHESSSFDVEK